MTYSYKSSNPRSRFGTGGSSVLSFGNKMARRIQSFANNNTTTSVSGCQSCLDCPVTLTPSTSGPCAFYCNVAPLGASYYCN
jgi:hypothetical protein